MNIKSSINLRVILPGYRAPQGTAVSAVFKYTVGAQQTYTTVYPEPSTITCQLFNTKGNPVHARTEVGYDEASAQFVGAALAPDHRQVALQFQHQPGVLSVVLLALDGKEVSRQYAQPHAYPIAGEQFETYATAVMVDHDYSIAPASNLMVQLPPTGAHWAAASADLQLIASGVGGHGESAAGQVSLEVVATGSAEHTNAAYAGSANVALALVVDGHASHGIKGLGQVELAVTFAPVGHVLHGQGARGLIPLALEPEGHALHAVGASGNMLLEIQAFGHVTHERYEVRGEVRETVGGLLLARSVRVYDQASGELVGSVTSLGGKFHVHCGLQPANYVMMPIDLSDQADDFAPPVICNVVSVLAQDNA